MLLGEGKLSRPVLRGPGGRKAAWLLGDVESDTKGCRSGGHEPHKSSTSAVSLHGWIRHDACKKERPRYIVANDEQEWPVQGHMEWTLHSHNSSIHAVHDGPSVGTDSVLIDGDFRFLAHSSQFSAGPFGGYR